MSLDNLFPMIYDPVKINPPKKFHNYFILLLMYTLKLIGSWAAYPNREHDPAIRQDESRLVDQYSTLQ